MVKFSNRTVGLSTQQSSSITGVMSTIAPIADMIIPGLGTGIATAANFAASLFSDVPCDPKEQCKTSSINWDGSAFPSKEGICCQPVVPGTAITLTQHKLGYKKWPGWWGNFWAGDWSSTHCRPDFLAWIGKESYSKKRGSKADREAEYPPYFKELWSPGHPCAFLPPHSASNMIIPEGFIVRTWAPFDVPPWITAPGGDQRDWGPGEHDLHKEGYADHIGSMSIRGPFTIWDFWAGVALQRQLPGWFTENWDHKPTSEELMQLVLGDPTRAAYVHMDLNKPLMPYASFWGPGWEKRLPLLQQASQQAQQQLQQQQQYEPPRRRRRSSRRGKKEDRRHGRKSSRWAKRFQQL